MQQLNINISFFKSIFDTSSSLIRLSTVLADIKNGKYQAPIEKCRLAIRNYEFDIYNEFKVKLPAVTFSGVFHTKRKKQFLEDYTKILVLDFDKIPRIDLFEENIKNDPYVFSCWLSPSATGYKVLIKTNFEPHEHELVFDSLVVYFKEKYNFDVDISGSDVTRLCLLSYDPNLFVNHQSLMWNEALIQEKTDDITFLSFSNDKKLSLNGKDIEIIKRLIRYLKSRNISITETYEKWYKIALAFSHIFPYTIGQKLFLQLSRLDGARHDEEKSTSLFEYCYRNNQKKIKLSTVLFYAKEKGFIP